MSTDYTLGMFDDVESDTDTPQPEKQVSLETTPLSLPKRTAREKRDNFVGLDTIEGFGSNLLDASVGNLGNFIGNEIAELIEISKTNDRQNFKSEEGAPITDYTNTLPRNVVSRFVNPRQYEGVENIDLNLFNFENDPDRRVNIARGTGEKLAADGGYQKYVEAAGTGAGFMTTFTAINLAVAARLAKDPLQVKRIFRELQTGAKDAKEALSQAPAAMIANYFKKPSSAATLDVVLGGAGGIGDKIERDTFDTSTGAGFTAGTFTPLIVTALAAKTYNFSPIRYGVEKTTNFLGGAFSRVKDAYARYRDPNVKASEQTSKQAQLARTNIAKEIGAAVKANPKNVEQTKEIEKAINKNLEESLPEAQIPGPDDTPPFQLTIAEQTLDPVLLGQQARLVREGTDEFRANAQRLELFEKGVENFRYNTFGGDLLDDTPAFVINTTTKRNEQVLKRMKGEIAETESIIKDTIPALIPDFDKAVAGGTVRDTIIGAREFNVKRMDKVAEDLGINTADPVAPASRVETAQKEITKTILQSEGEKALSYEGTNKLITRFLDYKGTLTFQDWKAFRDDVGSELGKAISFNNIRAMKELFSFKTILQNLAEKNTAGEGFASITKKLAKFNTIYGREHTNLFEQSASVQIRQKGSGSAEGLPVYVTPDEKVLDTFLANTNTMNEFLKLAELNPEMLIPMRSQILNRIAIASRGVKEEVNITGLNNHLNKYKEVYKASGLFPEGQNNTEILTQASNRLSDLNNRKTIIESNKVVRALGDAYTGATTIDDAFETALNSPRNFSDWVKFVKKASKQSETDLEPAFRQVIVKKIFDKVAKDPSLSFSKVLQDLEPILLGKFGTGNPDTGIGLGVKTGKTSYYGFSEKHVEDIKLLSRISDLQVVLNAQNKLTPEVGVTDTITEALAGKFGMTLPSLTSLTRSLQESRIGSRFYVWYIGTRALNAQNKIAQDALIKEAIKDPKVAKLLTSTVLPEGPTVSQTKDLQGVLFRIGSDYGVSKAIGNPSNLEPPPEKTIEIPAGSMTAPPPEKRDTGGSLYLEQSQAPTPVSPPASVPNNSYASSQNKPSLGIEELFPFDSTSAAIAKRRNPNQGIQSIL